MTQILTHVKSGLTRRHPLEVQVNLESVAVSVIQDAGMVDFEDGLWIGNHLNAQNGLQRVRTIPGVPPGAMRTPGFFWGQTGFQSA